MGFIKENKTILAFAIVLIGVVAVFFYLRGDSVNIPSGEATKTGEETTTGREISITDGTKHSIPLGEILSGGPPKDGIPSIDSPKFTNAQEAEFLSQEDVGLGLVVEEEARFYPYQILVWHEIVNDKIKNIPVLVTYCPLCATGVVFERKVNGETTEFGVSGRLWQSNLLMYNRADDPEQESLWSQVLGEAVVGPNTGEKLKILNADTVKWSSWLDKHPDTKVLTRDTGSSRPYGRDPYDNYYTSDLVSFGATFNDNRLGPKEFVLGIEIDGKFKAYHEKAIPEGVTTDTFNEKTITIEKSPFGEIRFFSGTEKNPVPFVGGFWFSWLAVHPETDLLK